MIPQHKLDFWASNGFNVLLKGKHGIGKTEMIKSTFNKFTKKWLYFSGATMDPWVDFVGVPKEVTGSDGTSYIELIRPKALAYDEVEAIFLDELNRTQPKVRNAIMELIQFKSINGKKFNNLKMIWAAVNPEPDDTDETQLEYQVESFDPAQEDRFHVIYELPYKPYKPYFVDKYGASKSNAAIQWWNELSTQMKDKVSPRRLDLILSYYDKGGDIKDVVDKKINVKPLLDQLKNGSYYDQFVKLFTDWKNDPQNEPAFTAFLKSPNIVSYLENDLKSDIDRLYEIYKLLPRENFIKILLDNGEKILTQMINKFDLTYDSDIIKAVSKHSKNNANKLSILLASTSSSSNNNINSKGLKQIINKVIPNKKYQNLNNSNTHDRIKQLHLISDFYYMNSKNLTIDEINDICIITLKILSKCHLNTFLKQIRNNSFYTEIHNILSQPNILTIINNEYKSQPNVKQKLNTMISQL